MKGPGATSRSERAPIPRATIAVLGLITIAVYGCWYYSFGVLLDPIIADTSWAEPALTAAFGASTMIGGIAGLGGGWLLDRFGSRVVFAIAAVLGGVAFQVASSSETLVTFVVASIIGGATLSALGMYHITQTAAVRVSPADTTRAIAVLTIWGAFASAIYIPAAGWLVEQVDWRLTLRILTGSAVVILALGAITVSTESTGSAERGSFRALGESLRQPIVRRYLVAIGLIGIGTSTLLVYQVPAMTGAGLPLTAASFWAGFRGFSQLGGRLPLMPIVRRFGVWTSLRIASTAIAVGMVILAFAGNAALALLFALVAGFGIGALSPLQGMATRDMFSASGLGTAMGLLGAMFLTVGAIGPAAAGVLADATGSRAVPVLAAAAVTAVAVVMLPRDAVG